MRTIATAALLFAGCGTDDSVVELGRIEFYHDPAIIEAPASAAIGEEFLVRVMSYGGGCISFERTDVELTKDAADFFPFDRRHIPGRMRFAHRTCVFIHTKGRCRSTPRGARRSVFMDAV